MTSYDYIVVGAGVIGSSTAYALAKQGKSTLLLEQFPIPHTRGSSHGGSRVTRKAFRLQEFHSQIMMKAYPMWETLEKEARVELFKYAQRVGMLSTTHSCHEGLIKYFTKQPKLLNSKDVSQMYPLMTLPENEMAHLDEDAGILYASKCVMAFQKVFLSNGGVIKDNCKVRSIIPGDTVTVHTDDGDFQAKGLVLACGPWSSEILSNIGVFLPLKARTVDVCYWKERPGYDHSKLPAFVSLLENCIIYGVPPSEYNGLMKITLHDSVPCESADTRDITDDELVARNLDKLKKYVASTFPHLIPEPAIRERCMYTITPDTVSIIDSHPTYKNIVFGAGFSGQGFKFAPVAGSMLADLVQNKTPDLLVDEMRASRFVTKSKL
ncbi:PIPOX [Bugula neritina]|uniref:PIPOX n=1 Tax=Bugula neritina TaxID=10212 RepID=A0A7J7IZ50_BUGNE|nr:PIPOX [Bugula neritina]